MAKEMPTIDSEEQVSIRKGLKEWVMWIHDSLI